MKIAIIDLGKLGAALVLVFTWVAFPHQATSRPKSELEAAFGGNSAGEGKKGEAVVGGATLDDLDPVTRGAFLPRERIREHEVARGLFESGLEPLYPKDARCPAIDHIFGEPWRGPMRGVRHHGADIPAPDETPILAIADGVVIAKYPGAEGFRGIEIVLQHAPEDTGLPVWGYTAYSHLKTMPTLEIGQRVRMGEPLGPTGRTGVPGRRREEHLHLGTFFSKSEKYVALEHRFIPVEGHYMDPVALMRRQMPLDSHSMKALPEAEKRVQIPYKLTTGEIVPPDTKIIWPYACTPKR